MNIHSRSQTKETHQANWLSSPRPRPPSRSRFRGPLLPAFPFALLLVPAAVVLAPADPARRLLWSMTRSWTMGGGSMGRRSAAKKAVWSVSAESHLFVRGSWERCRYWGRSAFREKRKGGKGERRKEPLPPTPHIRACLGSWRTMSSYSLGSYARGAMCFD